MNTCPHDPKTMTGLPIGMYHCPICNEMVLAGMDHPDWSYLDEEPGVWSLIRRSHHRWARRAMRARFTNYMRKGSQ